MAYEIIRCGYCGEVVWEGEFTGSYPNGYDMFVEQTLYEHYDVCSKYEKESICCPDCGEVLADDISPSYIYNNPNGYEMWEAQLLAQHKVHCPIWRKENGADEIIYEGSLEFDSEHLKPFKIVKDYTQCGYDGVCEYYRVVFEKGGTGEVDKIRDGKYGIREHVVEKWNAAIWQLFQDKEFVKFLDYDLAEKFYEALLYECFWVEKEFYDLDVEYYEVRHHMTKLIKLNFEDIPGVGDRFWFTSEPGNLKFLLEEANEEETNEDEADADEIVEEA